MSRQNKQYNYDEVATALSMRESGKTIDDIAQTIGRTPGAVNILLVTWGQFKRGKNAKTLSGLWRQYFNRYMSSNGDVAKSLREEVQTDASASKVEELLQTVENHWKATLQAVGDLVEYEAERRADQRTKELQGELSQLREFKDKAQDSNIAGTLRRHLMSNFK